MAKRGPKGIDWSPKLLKDIEMLAKKGLSNRAIHTALNISEERFYHYKERMPEIRDALKRGRAFGETKVVSALFEQAEKGSLGHIVFWLKNRFPEEWKDKFHNENENKNFDLDKEDLKKLSNEEIDVLKNIAEKLS